MTPDTIRALLVRDLGSLRAQLEDYPDEATIWEMCDLIRRLKPDIVLTHWRGSFHRDHRAAYKITMEGGFLAALPDVRREHPAHLIRGLYYLENWEDEEGYQPDLWVDVRERLGMLTKEKYHRHARYGYARGYQAQHYVDNIQRFFETLVWMDTRSHPLLAEQFLTAP